MGKKTSDSEALKRGYYDAATDDSDVIKSLPESYRRNNEGVVESRLFDDEQTTFPLERNDYYER